MPENLLAWNTFKLQPSRLIERYNDAALGCMIIEAVDHFIRLGILNTCSVLINYLYLFDLKGSRIGPQGFSLRRDDYYYVSRILL